MQTAGFQALRQQGIHARTPQAPGRLAARPRCARPERRTLDTGDFPAQLFQNVRGWTGFSRPPSHRNGRGEFYRSGRAGITSPARSAQGQQDEGGVSRRIHGRRLATRSKITKQRRFVLFLFLSQRGFAVKKKETQQERPEHDQNAVTRAADLPANTALRFGTSIKNVSS